MSKVILITGTSTGMGKLTALTLAQSGYRVIAAMRDSIGKNEAVARELGSKKNIEVIDLDVTNDKSVTNAINQSLKKYGKIDVLVNNAGVSGFGLAEGYSIEQVKQMMDVNFLGAYRTYQAVLPSMRSAKEGLIINISTGASGFTLPFMIPYFASKFALESLTEGMNMELKPYGIESVSIQSGVYPTEMTNGSKAGINPERQDIIGEYGNEAVERFNKMGSALFVKVEEYKMNPQTVADGIKSLIEMKKGTRPLRFPLDAVAQGTDQEFINSRADIKRKWSAVYGFSFE